MSNQPDNLNSIVSIFDDIFEALHQIIISFFFKLAIFTPALVNAVLVGLGIGSFAEDKWGFWAGVIAGSVSAIAIEAASIIASFNMDVSRLSSLVLPALYIIGSWIVVIIGLNDGWLVNVVGFVMPIFAISLPTVIASRKQYLKELEAKQQAQNKLLEYQKERTKQERAKARAAKVSNFTSNGDKKVSRDNALQWLQDHPDISPTTAANELGVTRQTIYNWLGELSSTTTENEGKEE